MEKEKSPEEMAAKIAAMRAEWQAIRDEVMSAEDAEMDNEETEAWMARRHRLLKEFLTRHTEALAAANPGAEMPDIAACDALMAAALRANEDVRVAEERLLQARADVADSGQALTEAMLGVLANLEALSPEDWAQMDTEQRTKTYDTLRELQEKRPAMLEELPLERRRLWEKS